MHAFSYDHSHRNNNISRWKDMDSQRERACAFLDYKISDILLAAVVAVMPLCSLIDYFIFKGLTIAGLSVCNFLLSATLVISTLLNIAEPKRRGDQFLLAGVLLFVTLLGKIVLQPLGDLPVWLSGHEYYFLVPLFAFCYANLATRKAPDLIGILLTIALPVCGLSLYFFLTSDYLGMVPHEIMLAYDVVGMPFMRMMGTFGSPNVAGSYFAVLLFLDLQGAPTSSAIVLLRRALLAICLFLTFSRMAIIGFLIAELLFFPRNKKAYSVKVGFSAVRVLIAIVGVFAICALFASLSSRGLYFFDLTNDDATNNVRFSKWAAFLLNGSDAILLGEPIGSSYVYGGFTLSDNSFLYSIASFGFAIAVLYWTLLFHAFKNCREEKIAIEPFLMVLVFLFLSDFIQLFPSCYCAVLLLSVSSSNQSNSHRKVGMS